MYKNDTVWKIENTPTAQNIPKYHGVSIKLKMTPSTIAIKGFRNLPNIINRKNIILAPPINTKVVLFVMLP